MSAHTPGPWVADGLVIEGPRGPDTDFDPMVIAALKGGKGLVAGISYSLYSVPTKAQGHANARLIAAAPDLLEALTDLIAAGKVEGPKVADINVYKARYEAAFLKARAAIAKASGAA